MFPQTSCLILLHVDFPWLFAFGLEVCEPEGRAFSVEATFFFPLSRCCRRFGRRCTSGAPSKIGCRANLCLSRSSSRRRPLHSPAVECRYVAEISAQLSRTARFQSSLLYSEGRGRVDRK